MSKIKQIKQKTSTGWSTPYPLGADVKNIDNITGIDLEELLYLDDPNVETTIQLDVTTTYIKNHFNQIYSYCDDNNIQLKENNTIVTESFRKSGASTATLVKHTMISSDGNLIITSFKRWVQNQNWKIKKIEFLPSSNPKIINISANTTKIE